MFLEIDTTLKEMLHSAPVGAILPVAQYGLQAWRRRTRKHTRSQLEARIIVLGSLIAALNDPAHVDLLDAYRRERDEAVRSLLSLAKAESERTSYLFRNQSRIQQWLLLSPPSNRLGWLLRIIFFILLALAIGPGIRLMLGVNLIPARILVPWIGIAFILAGAAHRAATKLEKPAKKKVAHAAG
jgi:hypothetical protein